MSHANSMVPILWHCDQGIVYICDPALTVNSLSAGIQHDQHASDGSLQRPGLPMWLCSTLSFLAIAGLDLPNDGMPEASLVIDKRFILFTLVRHWSWT